MTELHDLARIFVGDIAEAFHDMEFSVLRDPGRLEFAQRVMSETLQRVVDRARTNRIQTAPAVTARERKRRTDGSDQ